MTAVITVVTISGPFAVLALGRLLESFDVRTILFALGVGRILMAALFIVSSAARDRRCRRRQSRR